MKEKVSGKREEEKKGGKDEKHTHLSMTRSGCSRKREKSPNE